MKRLKIDPVKDSKANAPYGQEECGAPTKQVNMKNRMEHVDNFRATFENH